MLSSFGQLTQLPQLIHHLTQLIQQVSQLNQRVFWLIQQVLADSGGGISRLLILVADSADPVGQLITKLGQLSQLSQRLSHQIFHQIFCLVSFSQLLSQLSQCLVS